MNPFVLSPNEIKYKNDIYNPRSSTSEHSGSLNKAIRQSDQQLSLNIEPTINYTQYDSYINISSSNRDNVSYPLHYNYRIAFDTPYKNIKKIELISAIFPNQASSSSGSTILNEPFLIVDIDQLNYIDFPINNSTLSFKGFAILPLKAPNVGTGGTGGFIQPDLGCIYHTSRVFKTPLASLTSMTVKIRDHTGNLYDFNQPNGSTNVAYQNHLVFKITTEEKDMSVINQRNIF